MNTNGHEGRRVARGALARGGPGAVAGMRVIVMVMLWFLALAGGRPGVGAEPGAAPSPRSEERVTQAEASQLQLRGSTARVTEQLDLILEEFQRNGIGGEDVQLLTSIRGLLGRLGDGDMGRVVKLLQEARGFGESTEQRSRLLEAFSTQKSVSLKLRQILLEYQRQQELAGVAARLEELAGRQHIAMRETFQLAASAGGRKRDWLTENQRISLQLQVSEQQSLADEVGSVLERLETWSTDPDNDAAGRAAEVLERPEVKRLAHGLESVVKDFEAGRLMSATGRQRETRQLLRELARRLVPATDEMDLLQAAEREVLALIARQQSFRESTRQLPEKAAEIAQAGRAQAELVDDADVVRSQVADLDTAAGEQVAASVNRMQEARGLIESDGLPLRNRRLTAATQQELAMARLESAQRILRERIDNLEKQRASVADPQSNLEQVRADVAELLKREQELKSAAGAVAPTPAELRPFAPRQGDIGDRTAQAVERAGLDSTEAALRIGEAADQMRRAQRAFGEARNDAGAQQAAIDALGKALEELDRRLAELAKAREELAELEQLLERLIALIEAQQALNSETARMARKVSERSPAEAAREQNGHAAEARKIEGALPPTVPQAATYLGDGSTQMILAGNELGAGRAGAARPAQEEALENLHRARRELEERMAQLQEMLGQPPKDAPLDELARMIKQSQMDLNSAMSAEQLKSLGQGMKKADQRLKPATSGRMGRVPQRVRESLQKAEQSLAEGGAAAEGGDQAGAEGEAGRAQEALAAAAAALDLAMAGMGQQPGQGEGQGGEGNSPGQGQGKGRGKAPGSQAGKGKGDAGNFFGSGGGDGPRGGASGSGRFIGLPARDRAALLQSQGEKYPAEYAPMIEQYLKNLSDQVQGAPK